MSRAHVALLALAALLSSPSGAAADAILAPPADCPPGAFGTTSHAGTFCEARTCAADAECEDGRVCREQPLCVREVRVEYATYGSRGNVVTHRVATGVCGEGDACAPVEGTGVRFRGSHGGEPLGPPRCVRARRCVAPGSADAPAASGAERAGEGTAEDGTEVDGAGETAASSAGEATESAGAAAPADDPGPAHASHEESGGCSTAGTPTGGAWLLLALVGLSLRRRRDGPSRGPRPRAAQRAAQGDSRQHRATPGDARGPRPSIPGGHASPRAPFAPTKPDAAEKSTSSAGRRR